MATMQHTNYNAWMARCDQIARVEMKLADSAMAILEDQNAAEDTLTTAWANDESPEAATRRLQLGRARELWADLGDTPVDDNECIDQPFHFFEAGIHREEIWHWFEHAFNCSVAEDLMSL